MPTMCIFGITIKDNSICQLRLDFESFELDGGSAINKPCDRDVVEIFSGRSTNLGTVLPDFRLDLQYSLILRIFPQKI